MTLNVKYEGHRSALDHQETGCCVVISTSLETVAMPPDGITKNGIIALMSAGPETEPCGTPVIHFLAFRLHLFYSITLHLLYLGSWRLKVVEAVSNNINTRERKGDGGAAPTPIKLAAMNTASCHNIDQFLQK